ncbi:PHD finger protein EHD3 [Manihot esculenta]|uniref:Uncharacterized protein n=2 Tax=Manihot esculenta TaxID=3983 RepID=A0ACB7G3D0_MANES|nr:PHD finger protein EHD3 [Manihot esculenta]XP_043809428.1 PHD finger protein EHD3 [Manihot esculenta]KAG8633221.1 hypothetical protein MANES_18G083535v8 [Manihot esculenta]KAG8633222.1 hypothetical protein MANES_18G083535v8 [Manihot esculenta]
MGDGEGTSNGDCTGEGVQCLTSEAVNNGFKFRIGNDSRDWGSEISVGFQTYKRRKHTRSSSASKDQDDGKGSAEAGSKLADETAKELPDCFPEKQASLDGVNDVLHKQSRDFVLERICHSLNDDKGGIQGCIRDVLLMTVKESDSCDKDRHKHSSHARWVPNGTLAAEEHVDISKESLDESHRPLTEMCQHAFLDIILSEKFTLLCKLLVENFQEMTAGNLLGLSLINMRMKDGVYERSPSLFLSDIQLVWKKLQGIGNDLISLAKSLSDVSLTCCNEQFSTRGFNFQCKPEKMDNCGVYSVCTCRRCGDKADGKDCLVCDSCEEMYHVSCIEPAVKEIPPKSWYCASCTAVGMGSPHDNCVVCERLNAPRSLCDQAGDEKGSLTIEKVFGEFEETSNCSRDDFCQPPAGSRNICVCKFCGNEVEHGEKLRTCEHVLCPYKYYHVRCLTTNLLKLHGPLWYCPSCLCRVCLTDKDDSKIVLCDGCDNAYHMYCMSPPRTSVPRGKWFCRQCDAKIKEIRRARRAYEKQGYRMKKKIEAGKRASEDIEKKLDEKCEQESVKDRERMDMLLTAALYEEKLAGVRNT